MRNKLRFCLALKRLLEQGECRLTKDLADFASSETIQIDGKRVILQDREYVEQYFQKHCQGVCSDYDRLVKLGYEPRSESDLQDGLSLIAHLNKSPHIEDVKLLSASLFGQAKRIERSSFLSRILRDYWPKKQDIVLLRCFSPFYINQQIELFQLTALLGAVALRLSYLQPLDNLQKQQNKQVIAVTSENLAPFLHLNLPEGFLIYTEGFAMLESVVSFLKAIEPAVVVHFGDVDVKGLQIYEKIATRMPGCRFYPDKETLAEILAKMQFDSRSVEYPDTEYQTEEIKELAKFLNAMGGPVIEQETLLHLRPDGLLKFIRGSG